MDELLQRINGFAENNSDVLINIIDNLNPWYGAIYKIGLIIGMFLIIKAVVNEVSDSKNRHQQGFHGGTVTLVAGLFLVNFQTLTDSVSETLFNKQSDVNMLSYANSATEATSFNIYVTFAIAVVILVGIMGTIKGVMLLSASKSDTRKLGEAITHMIGGVAAINIQTIISMFGETVGGNVGTFISEQIIS